MIESIFIDFCDMENDSPSNLIDEIIIDYFDKDIIDLSQDRIINVRIFLAKAFY